MSTMIAEKLATAPPGLRNTTPILNWECRFKAWTLISQVTAPTTIASSFGVVSIVDVGVGYTNINQVTTSLAWNQVGFGSTAGVPIHLCGGNSGPSQSYVTSYNTMTAASSDNYPQVAYVGAI